jgi:ATP-binding cassette, subfamily B, bacterial
VRDFVAGFAAILRSGWRASPRRLLLLGALNLLEYVSWPLAPLALKYVTDAVVERDLRTATIAAACLPVLALLTQVAGHVAHVLWVEVSDLNLVQVNSELGALGQGARGLEHHERPEFADQIELLRTAGNPLYMSVRVAVEAMARALQLVVTIVMLALLEPALLLLLAFAVPPLVTSRWAFRSFMHAVWGDLDRSRRATFLLDLAIRADAAKEIRVFGLEGELRRRLRDTREDLRRRRFRAETTGVAVMSAGQLVFALGYVLGLLLVVRGAIDGEHTAGDVVLAFTLAAQTNELVYDIVGTTMFLQRGAEAMRRVTWLRRLVGRLYPPSAPTARVPQRVQDGIRLERVSFTYPGTEAAAVTEIDLDLPAGATVAFVGENGAGKTTLVKLLCRFYEPTSGRILLDGADLSELPVEEWRQRIAAGFQDFVRFELLARESVGVGDLHAIDETPAVAGALDRAGARDLVERLPSGLETQLGKSYTNGSELSGGQWQKVALARAMMRTAPLLLILDEPTASLDAHAEHVLFERYAASARQVAQATGGVAIFVSHRFSTVRMADRIVVVDEGRIVEQGTHEELVVRGGIYAELFAIQAAAYG